MPIAIRQYMPIAAQTQATLDWLIHADCSSNTATLDWLIHANRSSNTGNAGWVSTCLLAT
eukprot:1056302-Rhodomonas_salina.1